MDNKANPVETAYECAACNMLRKKCEENCVFAPHFPPDDPRKFAIAHWVFGANNIAQMLQDVPTEMRGDAVKSIVYEARARVRDPVYGCAGTVARLRQQMHDLQSQLESTEAEIMSMRLRQLSLLGILIRKS